MILKKLKKKRMKSQNTKKDSLENTTFSRKELMVMGIKLMVSNLHLSHQLKRSNSQMTIVSNKSKRISQIITLHANGQERSKLKNQDNTLSTLNQMMVLDYGLMETNL